MATVRKRIWTNGSGEPRIAWRLSYTDSKGARHQLQFPSKAEAERERIRIESEIAEGVHVADRGSITVLDAARAFVSDFEALVETGKRERTTLEMYDAHVRLHIAPFAIACVKLSRLSGPDCVQFATELETSRSDAMAKRVFATLRGILKFAIGRGWAKLNAAKDVSIRTAGARVAASGDAPTARVMIPSKAQIQALLAAAEARAHKDKGRALAMVHVLLFGGLRASEMRGLRHRDVDLDRGVIRVAQRADRFCKIGPVKSGAAAREVPIPEGTRQALRAWMAAAPKSKKDLLFSNGLGEVQTYTNVYRRWWGQLMHEAKLSTSITTPAGNTKRHPAFALHALRHAAVSLWIAAGAKEKRVQTWAGHEDVKFTLNTYGHLWPDETKTDEIVSAVERLIASE